ncbi:MAG: FtsX-like permease family protein [Planctomycetota bacterium]|nr:FtsX-like permease family protein [Planctomycetota bacterium]
MKTPLAWKNLTSSMSKCALAATGVGFAVVLMFMQLGFQKALIDNNVQVLMLFDSRVANLAVVSRARYNVSTEQRFSRRQLEYVESWPGISGSCAVSIERGASRVQVAGYAAKPIRVIAIELGAPEFFARPGLHAQLLEADSRDSAIVDTRSKSFYRFGRSADQLQQQWIELNERVIPVQDTFRLGTDFGNDGTLLMSERVHANYFPYRNPFGKANDVVDIGFLHADTDDLSELRGLAKQIETSSSKVIKVIPTVDLIQEEKDFWAKQTPVGKIFLIGLVMGLFVGAIICYQIQFTDITDHMPEFATLKAMGYGPWYFWSLILWQSFYLACLGFVPGIALAQGLYLVLGQVSGLIMGMDLWQVLQVFSLTLIMCAFSGALAIRKLFNADPANLF